MMSLGTIFQGNDLIWFAFIIMLLWMILLFIDRIWGPISSQGFIDICVWWGLDKGIKPR